MVLDQAHEQNSAAVKSDGGAVGLTQSLAALRCWMVAGHELVRMTGEFEASLEKKHQPLETRHREQTKRSKVTFGKQVKRLVEIMKDPIP